MSDAGQLKTLETEKGHLKTPLAEQLLDNMILKDLLGKSDETPAAADYGVADDREPKGVLTPRTGIAFFRTRRAIWSTSAFFCTPATIWNEFEHR